MSSPKTTRTARLAAVAIALPLALGGCGLGTSLAGVHDAPVEDTTGASISFAAGASVTERVLGEAAVAQDSTGKGAGADRTSVLTGPALAAADARVSVEGVDSSAAPVTPPADAEVLAVSTGTDWPRTILATTRESEVQQLHVLVADGPTKPYRLFASVPMAAGADVPALGGEAKGVTVRSGVAPAAMTKGMASWADAVSYPAPKTPPTGVDLSDPFSSALRTNAAAQDKELGDLATYRVTQKPAKDQISFTLADGGTLTFAPLTRTDTVTAGEKAKALTLPAPLKALVKDSTVTRTLSVTHLETVAFVQPKGGPVRVVGATEQLSGAKGE